MEHSWTKAFGAVGTSQTATVLDWNGPFAARVMSRLAEYDDRAPKQDVENGVVLNLAERKQA